jgi:hypothetical protein
MTPHLPHTKWYCKIFILLIYIYILYIPVYIYIQYWCIDGKYMCQGLETGEILALKGLSIRFMPSHINSLFSVNTLIVYLSCNTICKKMLFNLIIKKYN